MTVRLTILTDLSPVIGQTRGRGSYSVANIFIATTTPFMACQSKTLLWVRGDPQRALVKKFTIPELCDKVLNSIRLLKGNLIGLKSEINTLQTVTVARVSADTHLELTQEGSTSDCTRQS